MRLDKYLSHSRGLSRADARQAIRRGYVRVDGEVVKRADRPVGEASRVELGGQALAAPGQRYFMLHKPAGVVCAREDPTHPSVNSLLKEPRADALHAVGRLDADATGLVLLTDDGQWSHGITAPRRHRDKVYRVTLAEPLPEDAAARFAEGIRLQGEERATRPAELRVLSSTDARVVLREGRYHQVKRMFAALGNRVVALHREAIGPVSLDSALAPGQYRPLSDEEVRALA